MYDIAVIGGGSAGIPAAVQAARAGAKTILIEKNGLLGGTITAAAVNYPASFHAWGKQVIAGIGWELVGGVLREMGTWPVDPGDHSPLHLHVDRALFAALADEMVLASGAELLLHAMPARAKQSAGGAWRLDVCTKTGLRRIEAGALIDCTGDANVVSMAGLEVRRPEALQPGTLVVNAGGYDATKLDYDVLQTAFDEAVADGRLKPSDVGWDRGKVAFFLQSYGGNRIHVMVDGTTSESRTAAEVEGRAAMMRLYRFFRPLKGLENFRITFMAEECGIRETVTIKGRQRIAIEDYEAGKVYDDSVCYSHYSIDIHCPTWVDYRRLARGVYPTIPLGAMIPAAAGRRILAAGRTADGDRQSHSSYRVQAPCMAMGQAAAVAAVLATSGNCDIHEVPIEQIKAMLRKHGAIVPPVDFS